MDELELANRFDRERPRLRSVAYRIVGSLSEADDAMQEAWLRLQRTQAGEIDNLEGWLRTVVVRISLNVLRTRRSRAEEPLDAFVPEPVISSGARDDPEQTALLADDVRDRAAGRARGSDSGRTRRVRPARHVRRA